MKINLSKLTNKELKKFIRNTQNLISRDKSKGHFTNVSISLSAKGNKRAELLSQAKKAKEYRIIRKDTKKRKTKTVTKNRDVKPKRTAVDRLQSRTQEQFNKLKTSTLKKETRELEKEVKKRIDELEKAGLKSSAVTKFLEKGYSHGEDLQSLREYYMRLRSFLIDKRSTVSGEKQVRENVKSALYEFNILIKDKDYDVFFEIIDKAEEIYKQVFNPSIKYEVMEEAQILLTTTNLSVDEIAIKLAEFAKKAYEKTQTEYNKFMEGYRRKLFK